MSTIQRLMRDDRASVALENALLLAGAFLGCLVMFETTVFVVSHFWQLAQCGLVDACWQAR